MRFYIRTLTLFVSFASLFGLSCGSTNDDTPRATDDTTAPIDAIVFSVIGDVPYNEEQRDGLISLIQLHNDRAKSDFVIHVGDIKPGSEPCAEPVYKDVSGLLKEFSIPTFMILGDNEYNDCADPVAALELWKQHFLHFHKNWTFAQSITYQENRAENFAWVQEKVMFVGLNLVGGQVRDEVEWNDRLADNGNFLEEFVRDHGQNSKALVIFGHANMVEAGAEKFKPFTDVFRRVAREFDRPILYLQGDGHFWFSNRPYNEENILRVQIEGGATAVQVTVDANLEQPFHFESDFLK